MHIESFVLQSRQQVHVHFQVLSDYQQNEMIDRILISIHAKIEIFI